MFDTSNVERKWINNDSVRIVMIQRVQILTVPLKRFGSFPLLSWRNPENIIKSLPKNKIEYKNTFNFSLKKEKNVDKTLWFYS